MLIDHHAAERARMRREPLYAKEVLKEAQKALRNGETEVGQMLLRDVILSGVFKKLPSAASPRRAPRHELVEA
jgi:hypothetical protein